MASIAHVFVGMAGGRALDRSIGPLSRTTLSMRGIHVLFAEAVCSLPLLVWAAWPRRGAVADRCLSNSSGRVTVVEELSPDVVVSWLARLRNAL